ncbi:MAG: GldM family protein, partial [Bacteroidota bacterium]
HRMIMELADPTTGEIKRFEKSFTYEVGERAVTVAADKMNVLYAGVENPISIAAAGIPSAQIQVSATGVELQRRGGAKYIAVPKRVGAATITVAGGGLVPQQFNYRVKRIPDPVMKLGKHVSKTLPAATFRAQLGLIPDLPGFDFDAKCRVGSYEVTRVPRNSDVQSNTNEGPTLSGRAKAIVGQAKAGDIYYFDKIKVRCPGDDNSRALNALVFKIR